MFLKKIYNYNKNNKKELILFLKNNKKKSINMNYFISETFSRNIWLNRFLNLIIKKGNKYKYLDIFYKVMKMIKLYLRQQPIIFFNKSLKVKTMNFYFDVKQLNLKKKIIYIPKVIDYKKNIRYSFKILIDKMWSFIKFIKKNELQTSKWFNITEQITLFLVSFSLNNTSQELMLDHSLKLNKLALKYKFNLFRINKHKRRKKRKQKKKEFRVKGLLHSEKKVYFYKKENKLINIKLARLMTKKIYNVIFSGDRIRTLSARLTHKLLFHNKYITMERRSWQKKWKI